VDTKRHIHSSSAIMHRAYNSRQRRTQRDRKSDPNTCTKIKKRLYVIKTFENLFFMYNTTISRMRFVNCVY